MNAIINLGNPRKDMIAMADIVLGKYSRDVLGITGVEVYQQDHLLVTSPAYGAGMTRDALVELKKKGLVRAGDAIAFVGSMGSLNEEEISLGDVVIPNPCGCAYYGFNGSWLHQDQQLLTSLTKSLVTRGVDYREYKHGSSFAVFDPHTDHNTYTSSLYKEDVIGVDCGEVFLGLQFASENELRAAAVLYCSDSPNRHIADIGTEEFGKHAFEKDILLNRIATSILQARP